MLHTRAITRSTLVSINLFKKIPKSGKNRNLQSNVTKTCYGNFNIWWLRSWSSDDEGGWLVTAHQTESVASCNCPCWINDHELERTSCKSKQFSNSLQISKLQNRRAALKWSDDKSRPWQRHSPLTFSLLNVMLARCCPLSTGTNETANSPGVWALTLLDTFWPDGPLMLISSVQSPAFFTSTENVMSSLINSVGSLDGKKQFVLQRIWN